MFGPLAVRGFLSHGGDFRAVRRQPRHLEKVIQTFIAGYNLALSEAGYPGWQRLDASRQRPSSVRV
jgi:hypothetical protein